MKHVCLGSDLNVLAADVPTSLPPTNRKLFRKPVAAAADNTEDLDDDLEPPDFLGPENAADLSFSGHHKVSLRPDESPGRAKLASIKEENIETADCEAKESPSDNVVGPKEDFEKVSKLTAALNDSCNSSEFGAVNQLLSEGNKFNLNVTSQSEGNSKGIASFCETESKVQEGKVEELQRRENPAVIHADQINPEEQNEETEADATISTTEDASKREDTSATEDLLDVSNDLKSPRDPDNNNQALDNKVFFCKIYKALERIKFQCQLKSSLEKI